MNRYYDDLKQKANLYPLSKHILEILEETLDLDGFQGEFRGVVAEALLQYSIVKDRKVKKFQNLEWNRFLEIEKKFSELLWQEKGVAV